MRLATNACRGKASNDKKSARKKKANRENQIEKFSELRARAHTRDLWNFVSFVRKWKLCGVAQCVRVCVCRVSHFLCIISWFSSLSFYVYNEHIIGKGMCGSRIALPLLSFISFVSLSLSRSLFLPRFWWLHERSLSYSFSCVYFLFYFSANLNACMCLLLAYKFSDSRTPSTMRGERARDTRKKTARTNLFKSLFTHIIKLLYKVTRYMRVSVWARILATQWQRIKANISAYIRLLNDIATHWKTEIVVDVDRHCDKKNNRESFSFLSGWVKERERQGGRWAWKENNKFSEHTKEILLLKRILYQFQCQYLITHSSVDNKNKPK